MIYQVNPSDNLNEAIKKLEPGDILNLESGIYNHQVIDVVLMGTPDKPITIQGLDPKTRPVISGGAPRNLAEANERGVGINHGLPDGRYAKRNMNKGSMTYGAEARNKGLLNFQHDSGNYIIRDVVFTDSLGRILNHEAASTDRSQNITFINVDMHWARLQILSIKNVANVKFLNCRFSNGACFYQTSGRPGRGPEGDLQTHNAGLSFGGVDGLEMIDCVVWDINGEGVILSANRVMSKNIIVRNFTGYDCYKNPIYGHAFQDAVLENILIYRSAENQALGEEGRIGPDDPVRKTNGLREQSSEGNKPWGIATKNVRNRNVICHHTNGGLILAGSPNTNPISNISFQDCIIINSDGTALTMLGNEPKNITVTGNIFYHNNPNQKLADGAPSRYDDTSLTSGNKWSNRPEPFYTGAGDVYGDFTVPIPTEPLKRGTLVTDLIDDPDPGEPPVEPPVDKPRPPQLGEIYNPDGHGIYSVEWSEEPNAVEYRLQQQINGGGWGLVYIGPDNQFIFLDQEIGDVCHRVRVYDGAAYSDWSNVACTVVGDEGPPEPPEPPATVTARLEVGGVVWTVTVTENSVHATKDGDEAVL